MKKTPFQNGWGKPRRQAAIPPICRPFGRKQGYRGGAGARPAVRSRLTGLLSRRNTASHRCAVDPDTGRSPSVRSRPGRDVRGFLLLSETSASKTGPPHGQPRFQSFVMTTYGGITHIRLRGSRRSASSQPAAASSPVFGESIMLLFPSPVKRDFLLCPEKQRWGGPCWNDPPHRSGRLPAPLPLPG